MDAAAAAERDEHEFARVEAALHRDEAYAVGHLCIHDAVDPERRLDGAEPERRRDALADCASASARSSLSEPPAK